MKEEQIGSEEDCDALVKSIGLAEGMSYEAEEPCLIHEFNLMLGNGEALYEALHKTVKEPLFANGMAQPIFPYGDTIRFCVYVETDYDTDNDGKLDLVKALVQLPGAVLDGMQVATIYEARPYITGCNSSMNPGGNIGSQG